MILIINTIKDNGEKIAVALKEGVRIIYEKEEPAKYAQAEKLLPAISAALKEAGRSLASIKKIEVADQGGGFTALRIGIVTANSLGYALNIPVSGVVKRGEGAVKSKKQKKPFDIVVPRYEKKPNITKKKRKVL